VNLGKKVKWDFLLWVLSRHVHNRVVLPNEMIRPRGEAERARYWDVCAWGSLCWSLCLLVIEGCERVLTVGDNIGVSIPCPIELGGTAVFAAKSARFHSELYTR